MLCNPLAQAEIFNKLKTELNILVGLCVGHDTLFFRYSEAPVTVLVAKDRRLGHNPVAALYLSNSYYSRLKEEGDLLRTSSPPPRRRDTEKDNRRNSVPCILECQHLNNRIAQKETFEAC